jgi:hypothetical protein
MLAFSDASLKLPNPRLHPSAAAWSTSGAETTMSDRRG